MALESPKRTYSGRVREIEVGAASGGFRLGGAAALPFLKFEGDGGQVPRLAMEVNDIAPAEWAAPLVEALGGVVNDPVAWAKRCVDEFHADFVHLELVGTDPNGRNLPASEAAKVARAVADAVSVPLAVWGSSNVEKDAEVLRAVAEACQGRRLLLGPVQEGNLKQLGAAIIGYGHTAVASTPIDVNLQKQLNIQLTNLGVGAERIVNDPTVGGVGYGLEYTYSVMERARLAALTSDDDKLQFPNYCNVGRETWKVKEAKLAEAADPKLGNAPRRGILLESTTAAALLLAGAEAIVLRHPESVKLVRWLAGEYRG
jgi:acetyl-CoA decarbonylase/synthase, CODH/ACS complex subunit delta